ncbi:Uncharacterized protein DAT39_009246, partial [Clarias magur]
VYWSHVTKEGTTWTRRLMRRTAQLCFLCTALHKVYWGHVTKEGTIRIKDSK